MRTLTLTMKFFKMDFDYPLGGDVVDRIHSHETVYMIGIFAIILLAMQMIGEPLQCFVPAEFTPYWEQYSEQYCFVENTYFVPLNSSIPDDIETREQLEISYYQWIPIMLAIQAFLFAIPHHVWRMFYSNALMNVSKLVSMAHDAQAYAPLTVDAREAEIQLIATHIKDYAVYKNTRRFDERNRNTISYLFLKLLLLANVVGQIFLLNAFLGTKYTFWGAEIFKDLNAGNDWQDSGHFPRVTVCDFDVRVLGNVHRYSLQCVLIMNMFGEKIFVFLWWWFNVLAAITIINLLYWCFVSIFGSPQGGFVAQYLPTKETTSPKQKEQIRDFTQLLGADGIIVLRLISKNAGEVFTTHVVRALWNDYTKEEPKRGLTKSVFVSPSADNNKYDA